MSIWPPLIYIAITFVGIGMLAAKDKLDVFRFIAEVLLFGLLYWGGFFDPLLRISA
jgi:hypothetical protein